MSQSRRHDLTSGFTLKQSKMCNPVKKNNNNVIEHKRKSSINIFPRQNISGERPKMLVWVHSWSGCSAVPFREEVTARYGNSMRTYLDIADEWIDRGQNSTVTDRQCVVVLCALGCSLSQIDSRLQKITKTQFCAIITKTKLIEIILCVSVDIYVCLHVRWKVSLRIYHIFFSPQYSYA